jgi:hypothetical protein
VPLFSNRLRFLDVTLRRVWLSIFGGIPVAHVFVTFSPNSPRVRKLSLRQWAKAKGWLCWRAHQPVARPLSSRQKPTSGGETSKERSRGYS